MPLNEPAQHSRFAPPLRSTSPVGPCDTACEQPEHPPLLTALKEHENAIESLRSAISAHAARLGPVLAPIPAENSKTQSSGSPRPPIAPLVEHMEKRTVTIYQLTQDIRQLTENLCL